MVGPQRVDNDENEVAPMRSRRKTIRAPRSVLQRIPAGGGKAVDGMAVQVMGTKKRIKREAHRLVFHDRWAGEEAIELESAYDDPRNGDHCDETRPKSANGEPGPIKPGEVCPYPCKEKR